MTISQKEPPSPWVAYNLENGLIYSSIVVTAHILIVEAFLGLALCLILLLRVDVHIPKIQNQGIPYRCHLRSLPAHLKADNKLDMGRLWKPHISILFSYYLKEKLFLCYPQMYSTTKIRELPFT